MPSSEEMASELADAAINDREHFDERFLELDPSSRVMARAICIATTRSGKYNDAAAHVLKAYLQSAFNRSATRLTWWIIVLTTVQLLVAVKPLFHSTSETNQAISFHCAIDGPG
jgi:hypothetical protein